MGHIEKLEGPIIKYLTNGEELEDKMEARKLRVKVARFTMIDEEL